jgi:hypothetical protein
MKINYLNREVGYAPNVLNSPTTASGTQAAPLDNFYSSSGATGNKTTNKDLPEWLRRLGMKGDAYAGGMLKPQIRYGFWFKDGKINFADGTSYAAKKTKGADGKVAYSYTGADGSAQTYSPTDEQNAYNKAYKDSTSNQSFLDKAKNTVGFENFNVKRLWEGIKENPTTLLTGPARTPTSTWVHNTIFGTDLKPLTRQLGGATDDAYDEYGKPTGYAKPLNEVAQAIAAIYGAKGLGNAAGNVFGGAGGPVSTGAHEATHAANSGGVLGGAVGGGAAGAGAGGGGAAAGGIGGNMGWGDWVNLGLQLGGSFLQGQGAKDAAEASVAGIREGIAEQRRQFDLSRSDQLPWMQAGTAALGRLQDPTAFTKSPDYDFVLGEQLRGVENSAAARGGLFSGNTGRALQERAANVASGEYGNWFNRNAALAGLGQTSAQSLGTLGQNNANNVSNLLNQQGNARASGIEGQTNALTGGISDFLSWYNRRRGG